MLTQADIDRLESYLFNASLQDVPKVFGKVLPFLFAELRVMQAALDQRTEDFFNERATTEPGDDPTGRGTGQAVGAGGRAVANSPAQAEELQNARHPGSVLPVFGGATDGASAGNSAGLGGSQAGGASGVGLAPVVNTLGGEVRPTEGQPASSGEQDAGVVKRKRGRPRKVSLEIEPVARMEGTDAGA